MRASDAGGGAEREGDAVPDDGAGRVGELLRGAEVVGVDVGDVLRCRARGD